MNVSSESLRKLVEALVERYDASTTPDPELVVSGMPEINKGLATFYIRYLGQISSEETLTLLQAWSEEFPWLQTITVDDLPTIQSAMAKMYDDRRIEE
ncbi:MAG: hypothetical protein HZA34_04520 [Candidatus Pacebacteria bacterium]|nr:hypothetical protein [Candidatus Paceibacterota bacterium]